MTAAPAETSQFVVLRSPWDRLGSVLDVRKRLHRTRGRFHRWIHISTGPQPDIGLEHHLPNDLRNRRNLAQVRQLLDPELSGEPRESAHAV